MISIVIPTYNERENIRVLIPRTIAIFEENGFSGEIIVVDDGSEDGTAEEVEMLTKNYGNIRLIQRGKKMGLGSAYKTGFKAAKGDIIFEMDADLSHDPLEIPNFIKKIEEGNDLVIGSRYIKEGDIKNWSYLRILVSKTANYMANRLLKLDINDATSGYRAYKKDILNKMDMDEIKSDGYAFQVEMVYFTRKNGFRIAEIPIIFTERRSGLSKLGYKEVFDFFKRVLELWLSF